MNPLRTRIQRWGAVLIAAVAQCAGCSQLIDPNVPEPIHPYVEPKLGGDYLLYRPSSYDRTKAWPLVVVCHSTFPDSPVAQIRRWTELAEDRGLLVVAPKLGSPTRWMRRDVDKQLALLRRDEERILATIDHVRAGHTVSPYRVFIHGYSGSACTALHVGLRSPTLFRAISLAEPKFKSGYMADADDGIDGNQPVFVTFSVSDSIGGEHGGSCVDWMRHHGCDVREATGGKHRAAGNAVAFYGDVVRRQPMVFIRAFAPDPSSPLEFQFKLGCSVEPARFHWTFGDGGESPVAEPVHAFDRPGTYRITAIVADTDGGSLQRSVDLEVPRGRLTPTRAESP